MGKGPGAIYKDCLAMAKREDRLLSSIENNDIQKEINIKTKCCTLYEKDIRLAFFRQNYSEKTTDKALRQWAELDLVQPYVYMGHKVFLFLDTVSKINTGAE